MKLKVSGFLARIIVSVLRFLPVKVAGLEALPGPAEVPAGGATLEMDLSLDRPCVGVTIDGDGPYPFILDTGAAASIIDAALARELELREVGKALVGDPSGGEPVETRSVAANRLTIGAGPPGGVGLPEANLICVDLETRFGDSFAGILSIGHFSESLLTFDFPARCVRLCAGDLRAHEPGVMDYRPRRGLIEVDAEIGGRSIPLHLDTGAPGGFTLLRKTADRLRLRSDPVEGKTARMLGTEVVLWHARLDGKLRLAGHEFEDPEIELVDVGDRGTLGPGVLRRFAVTIDQKNRRIRFRLPAG